MVGDARSAAAASLPEAMYFVVVAAREYAALPAAFPSLSLFTDVDDAEQRRVDHEAREVLRLDGLLRERDKEFRDFVRHSRELEAMVAHRDDVIAARARSEDDLRRQLAAVEADRNRLQKEIDAQERIIGYRASARWWLKLPWVRARRLWTWIRRA